MPRQLLLLSVIFSLSTVHAFIPIHSFASHDKANEMYVISLYNSLKEVYSHKEIIKTICQTQDAKELLDACKKLIKECHEAIAREIFYYKAIGEEIDKAINKLHEKYKAYEHKEATLVYLRHLKKLANKYHNTFSKD